MSLGVTLVEDRTPRPDSRERPSRQVNQQDDAARRHAGLTGAGGVAA